MWNFLRRICFILSFSLQFLFSLFAQRFDKSEWSGTVTFIYKTIAKHSGPYSEFRYLSWDILDETRMEATITKGKGNAQATDIRETTSTTTDYGPPYSSVTTTEHGLAHGSDTTELDIAFNNNDNTYSISIPTPRTIGSLTTTSTGGKPRTTPMGSDAGSMILLEDQKLGENKNVLAGDSTTDEIVGESEYITIIKWSFVRGPINVDLIVEPLGYNTWLPSPGSDEKTPGSQISIGLQLKGKNGKPPSLRAKYFELELKNTSRENGITINYPAKNLPSMGLPDLGFLPDEGATVASDGQTIKVICEDGKTGSAQVASYDGGGYTTLSVEAVLEGGIRVKGHLEKTEGPTDILLPKRKEGSRIATSWLNDNGNPGEDDDLDSSPGTENAGDGLTAYEEYRGVWSQGKFKRLSPKKKELGVGIENKSSEQFAPGIALLKAAAGIDVIILNEDELDIERVFNKNSLAGGHKQYALKLYNGDAHGNEGVNIPAERHNKTPKLSDSVIVDIQYIRSGYISQDSAAMKGNKKLPYTAEDDIASTVAHELAHGIHVAHHGPPSDEPSGYESYIGAPVVCKIYDADGNLIMDRPFKIRGRVGSVGCDESGDLNCIMVYTSFYQWAYRKGEDGSLIYRVVPYLPQPKHLCTLPKGTGINANGYFGNATEGNCLSQIKVRDE